MRRPIWIYGIAPCVLLTIATLLFGCGDKSEQAATAQPTKAVPIESDPNVSAENKALVEQQKNKAKSEADAYAREMNAKYNKK